MQTARRRAPIRHTGAHTYSLCRHASTITMHTPRTHCISTGEGRTGQWNALLVTTVFKGGGALSCRSKSFWSSGGVCSVMRESCPAFHYIQRMWQVVSIPFALPNLKSFRSTLLKEILHLSRGPLSAQAVLRLHISSGVREWSARYRLGPHGGKPEQARRRVARTGKGPLFHSTPLPWGYPGTLHCRPCDQN